MKSAPPGYKRVYIADYKPAGQPPQGSVWYVDTTTGAATSPSLDESEAIARAWALYYRLAAMLRKEKAA